MEFKDFKQHVKELMGAMGRTGMKRLVIKVEDAELELERENPEGSSSHQSPFGEKSFSTTEATHKPLPAALVPPVTHENHHPIHNANKVETGKHISSPMVGTFYTAVSPEAPPLVNKGDLVTKDTVVCIIEAMKVMNEIKAGVEGTVIESLVTNGDPVEFGTKLFRIS